LDLQNRRWLRPQLIVGEQEIEKRPPTSQNGPTYEL
jgi:hypothetical protein